MTIEISNLKPAGSDLFAGEESFLTDLQEADSNRVFGGGSNKGKKNSKASKNPGVPGIPFPVYVPFPFPVYGYPSPCAPMPCPVPPTGCH